MGESLPIRIALSQESPPTSYVVDGHPAGMFKEILEALFELLPQYKPQFRAYPWNRAQFQVQNGDADVFCTYNSESRRVYADFTQEPLYLWDYGNLVYNQKNPKKAQIENAKDFQDLKDLIFISQEGVAWEKENVPDYIQRYMVLNPLAMMHMAFLRGVGDFFIMGSEQALHYAKELGYTGNLGMKKVRFIPNSQIPFYIGIRKSYPDKELFLEAVESAIKDPGFLEKKNRIIRQYQENFH